MACTPPFLTLMPGGRLRPAPSHRTPHACSHRDLRIDMEAGFVECRTCGVDLDPFAMLARYAEEEGYMEDLQRQISRDLARGVLACARCGAVPAHKHEGAPDVFP